MNPVLNYSLTNCPNVSLNPGNSTSIGNGTAKNTGNIRPTKIHINPKMCSSRNIYINKALYSAQPLQATVPQQKSERVYYNPRFFSKPPPVIDQVIPIKKESNIHVNPNFLLKRDANSQTQVTSALTIKAELPKLSKSTVSSGIHVNPNFLRGFDSKTRSESSNPSVKLETDKPEIVQSSSLTPKQRYVTKYKIVRKKVSPSVISDPSVFRKSNLKKINQTPARKSKLKIVKGKFLSYISQSVIDQKYNFKNKYSFKRNASKYKTGACVNKKVQSYPVLSNRSIALKYKQSSPNLFKTNVLNSYKKSILQQKIEARRRGKSSFNYSLKKKTEFKSKYKYVRSPQNTVQKHKTLYNKHHFHKVISHAPKSHERYKSEFKTIGKTKLVRKTVLQKHIESRTAIRKSLNSSIKLGQRISSQKKFGDRISKYKIVRSNNALSPKKPRNTSKISSSNKKQANKKKKDSLIFSSAKYRSDKRKKVAAFTKKLRKNNQPCPFYNRFGHCKGKERGTCLLLHDPKYITICKRFVKGDCKDEKCSLSHDIRPEKMPTCHHYLAGICKKADCPYLHIKVNQKAPICRAFLQGFCADVFNCTKRHEYICPMFAEKGSCLRGKSCRLPHRTATNSNKLLEPNELPLLNRRKKEKRVRDNKVSITNDKVSIDSSETPTKSLADDEKQVKPKEFTRYFLAPLSDDESKDDCDDSSSE